MNAKLVLPGIIALDAALINTKGLQEKLKGQGANLLNELGVVMLILTENPIWTGAKVDV
jgi:hypothetical protein